MGSEAWRLADPQARGRKSRRALGQPPSISEKHLLPPPEQELPLPWANLSPAPYL